MPDLVTTLAVLGAIAAIIGAIAASINAIAAFITSMRTPKLPEPPITPVCTTILGASMDSHLSDLPTLHRGVGFDR